MKSKAIGKRFGILTVLSHGGYTSGGVLLYNVKCDCGNEKTIRANNLYSQKSCGCLLGQRRMASHGIPSDLKNVKSKMMRDGKLVVFENGEIFRVKGELFYRCSKTSTSRGGRYQFITYTVRGKQKHEYVHRIVAEAFISNPNKKGQVNHLDNNGHNNDVKNLEWVTGSENVIHARETLGNYSMKNAKPCIFCESNMTRGALQICRDCYRKMEKFKKREKKLSALSEKYSCIDLESLSIRNKSIVTLTISGHSFSEIADTYKITPKTVSRILNDILKRNKEVTS